MRGLILVVVWISCGILAAGWWSPMAFHEWPLSMHDKVYAKAQCRTGLAFGIVGGPFAFIPIGFATGFGAYGWSLECKPPKGTH